MSKVEEYKKLCSAEGGSGTKEEKEKLLEEMTNEEIDELIKWTTNIYGKIWLNSFKEEERSR